MNEINYGINILMVLVQGDNARDVEASEVQGHILAGYPVCADTDPSIGSSSVLGIWRHASKSLQRFCSPPKITFPGHGCHFNAHPPGNPTIHIYTHLLSIYYNIIYS